jgi:glycosyltransferase involved in cell wall biosynthesis
MVKIRFVFSLVLIFGVALSIYFVRSRTSLEIVDREICLNPNPQIPEKVLICGVCRNIEKAIPNTTRSIRELGSRFLDYRVIIYEDNSTDDTSSKLRAWAENEPHAIFLSEKISSRKMAQQLPMRLSHRTCKIARARNIVLDVAMQKKFDDFKYVIWADLDFLEPWSVDAIVETILHPEQEWDAVFANGLYDLFALRTPELPIGFELVGSLYWDRLNSIRKAFVMDENDSWKKVYSAFGGLGIYKREAIRGCRYSGVITKDLERVVNQWLSAALRQTNDVLLLSEYQNLVSKAKPVELSGPIFSRDRKSSEDLAVRLPKGKVVWFSCTKDASLPWTCEHVPFHASMILHGHDRIFINPKIRCNP